MKTDQKSMSKNYDSNKFVEWKVNEKIGNVMMRNKKKWRDLEVGGTAANSSTKANLPCEESGCFLKLF